MMNERSNIPVQARLIRRRFPDTVLLFRVGTHVEAWDSDAIPVADAAGTPLRSAVASDGRRHPVTRFAITTGEGVITAMIAAGHKVAICEPVGEP